MRFGKVLEETDKYLTHNEMTLNGDETESYFFVNHISSDREFSFLKARLLKTGHACCYLGVQFDSNLAFENHLFSVLIKMAKAIPLTYSVRKKILLKSKI